MAKALFKLLTVCWLLSGVVSFAHAANELIFGVYPVLSPSQTVERFSPLKDHLSKALGMPVTLRSAPDFTKFIERTREGEYDIIFTAPHMGRLAEKRDNYKRLAQAGEVTVVALTRKDGPVQGLPDLKGRSIAIGAKLSLTYQIVKQALGKQGLVIDRDVKFIDAASFSNVTESIIRGEADAGATVTMLADTAPVEQRANLREIYRAEPVPGFLLLGHVRLPPATLKKIEQALFDFKNTEAGRTYFMKTQQVDFRPLDEATMKRIDPYTAVLETQ